MTQIVRAALRGALRNIEITMNTSGAARQLREAVTVAEGRLNIGAGTVINLELLDEAVGAGAAFVVTPTVEPKVIAECVNQKSNGSKPKTNPTAPMRSNG